MNAPQLAQFALAAIAQAQINMDDQSLAAAQATRQFLRAIASGELVVAPPGPPINGADGVIPAGGAL